MAENNDAPDVVRQLLDASVKERKRILVIGDALMDRWVYGRVDECQDGCPKFVQERDHWTAGGAANAEACLEPWPVNRTLWSYASAQWPTKCRFVDATSKAIVLRWDDETKRRNIEPWMHTSALEYIPCAAAVLLSDYDKGFLTPAFIAKVAAACKERGIPCVADCKRAPYWYAGCILKGNATWGSKHRLAAVNQSAYVETRGQYPPNVWEDGKLAHDPSYSESANVQCVNHVGAGDCFAAHLTLALAYGLTLKDAAAIAHSAGRVYVQHPHNRPPTPREIWDDRQKCVGAVSMATSSIMDEVASAKG